MFSASRPRAAAWLALGLLLTACGATAPSLPTPVAVTATPTGFTDYTGSYPAPVLGLVVDPALRVVEVAPDSGAARAGVRPGDTLASLGGTALTDTAEGQRVAQAAVLAGAGPVAVVVRRAGQELKLDVQPAPPAPGGSADAPLPTVTPLPPGYGYY